MVLLIMTGPEVENPKCGGRGLRYTLQPSHSAPFRFLAPGSSYNCITFLDFSGKLSAVLLYLAVNNKFLFKICGSRHFYCCSGEIQSGVQGGPGPRFALSNPVGG